MSPIAQRSNAPLLWRMRHSIGRVWFWLAIAMAALGAFVIVVALATQQDVGQNIGIGFGLLTGGALLAVGFRRKGKRK